MKSWRIKNDFDEVIVGVCNEEEYNNFLDIAESEGLVWTSGSGAKEAKLLMEYPVFIRVRRNGRMSYGRLRSLKGEITVWAKDLHNYAVQARIHNENKRRV